MDKGTLRAHIKYTKKKSIFVVNSNKSLSDG